MYVAGLYFMVIILYAIFFSFIFWVLTFFAKWTFSEKYFNFKLNFYECGFKSLTKQHISYEVNYLTVILFVMLYDGEFLVLIPMALNNSFESVEIFFGLACFLIWLLLVLLFDLFLHILEWQV